MAKYQPGDYVKAEFKDEETGESERIWVVVDSCDDEAGVLSVVSQFECGRP